MDAQPLKDKENRFSWWAEDPLPYMVPKEVLNAMEGGEVVRAGNCWRRTYATEADAMAARAAAEVKVNRTARKPRGSNGEL